ncbi:MAG: hypothetical protein KIS92_10610 [Planctomycetota bacterium]|nr:hypothetical protein [Planctomycetota bacterium]
MEKLFWKFGGVQIDLPQAWKNTTPKDGPVSFEKENGVGALQFTTAIYEGGKSPQISLSGLEALLVDFCSKNSMVDTFDRLARRGAVQIVGCSARHKGDLVRIWYLSDGDSVVFATYVCEWEHRGLELEACEKAIASLVFCIPESDKGP